MAVIALTNVLYIRDNLHGGPEAWRGRRKEASQDIAYHIERTSLDGAIRSGGLKSSLHEGRKLSRV